MGEQQEVGATFDVSDQDSGVLDHLLQVGICLRRCVEQDVELIQLGADILGDAVIKGALLMDTAPLFCQSIFTLQHGVFRL